MADDDAPEQLPRGMWTGTISFGLVSVPVSLMAGVRSGGVPLQMLDQDGTPLKRRYFCPEHNREIHPEHIIRGFELEDGRFVPVTEEELEALEPEKTRDIDLKLFVNLDEIDPIYFERPYFMLPAGENDKAYRLLAEAMESSNKAGIARFVMREKEYLVAIIARDGLLRAQTMRFHDEVRTPGDVGLEDDSSGSAAKISQFSKTIKSLSSSSLKGIDLSDHRTRKLLKLIESKVAEDRDVIDAPSVEMEPQDPNVKDLMQAISQSVEKAKRKSKASRRAKSASSGDRHGRLEDQSKGELYQQAAELDISGRTRMNKRELAQAIRRHGRP